MIDWILLGKLIYDAALLVALAVVVRSGARDEKLGIMIVVLGSGATALNRPLSAWAGIHWSLGLLAIDAAALIAFDALMVRSNRFWPVWASGVQLAAVSLDAAKAISSGKHSHLWIQGKFAYLLLAFIMLGCWSEQKSKPSRLIRTR